MSSIHGNLVRKINNSEQRQSHAWPHRSLVTKGWHHRKKNYSDVWYQYSAEFKCIHLAIANATGVKHTCCICGSCRCSSRIRKRGCLKWNINQRVWRSINAPLSGHINDLIALKQLCQSQWRMTTSVQQMEKKKPLQEIILLSGWCREARPEHWHLKSAGRGRPCTIMIGDGKICQRCKCPRYTIHVGGEGGGGTVSCSNLKSSAKTTEYQIIPD